VADAAPDLTGTNAICRRELWSGQGHIVIIDGRCQTCGGRPETADELLARMMAPTGRMVWLDAHGPSEGAFEDRAKVETAWIAAAPVGAQSGTYWRTSRVHDGMTVWRWGGRDRTSPAVDRG
jgi:hypothetical protein